MSSAQKGIKYAAICFAILLIITIISGIISVGLGLFKVTGFITNYKTSSIDTSKYTTYLDVNLKYTSLKIVKGDTLKIENTNNKINIKQDENKITITDSSNIFSKKKDYELIIYIPDDLIFDMVNISSGAGKIKIDGLNANIINFEFGAGKATLDNIIADKADIETGAGQININNSKLNDLNLELGLGEANINADITGKSNIECGVGKTTLNLSESINNYSFEFDKGIGSITLNNKEVSDNDKIGYGINSISIDGGIGKIVVNTNIKEV